jgi:hypothetical protein
VRAFEEIRLGDVRRDTSEANRRIRKLQSRNELDGTKDGARGGSAAGLGKRL